MLLFFFVVCLSPLLPSRTESCKRVVVSEVASAKAARAAVLRFGSGVQRQVIVKAPFSLDRLLSFALPNTSEHPLQRMNARMNTVYTHWQALSEFSSMWLDEFDQTYLPADAVQIVCALSTTATRVPPKTPKDRIYKKWKQEVESMLEYTSDLEHLFYVGPDDILEVTQRLGKIGATEGVRLAACRLCVV